MIYVLYDDDDNVIGFVVDEDTAIAYCQQGKAWRYQSVEAFTKPLWPRPADLHQKAEYNCSAFCCEEHGVVDVYTIEGKLFDVELHVSANGTIS